MQSRGYDTVTTPCDFEFGGGWAPPWRDRAPPGSATLRPPAEERAALAALRIPGASETPPEDPFRKRWWKLELRGTAPCTQLGVL